MDQKDRVFTPAFVANLFLIAGTVFLLLKVDLSLSSFIYS